MEKSASYLQVAEAVMTSYQRCSSKGKSKAVDVVKNNKSWATNWKEWTDCLLTDPKTGPAGGHSPLLCRIVSPQRLIPLGRGNEEEEKESVNEEAIMCLTTCWDVSAWNQWHWMYWFWFWKMNIFLPTCGRRLEPSTYGLQDMFFDLCTLVLRTPALMTKNNKRFMIYFSPVWAYTSVVGCGHVLQLL